MKFDNTVNPAFPFVMGEKVYLRPMFKETVIITTTSIMILL